MRKIIFQILCLIVPIGLSGQYSISNASFGDGFAIGTGGNYTLTSILGTQGTLLMEADLLCAAQFKYLWTDSVAFTDMSTGNLTSWSWDFGDGNYSKLQNPKHKYSKDGSYKVSLTVYNESDSCISTITKEVFAGSLVCKADFNTIINQENGLARFTSLSTGAAEYFWNFGNGDFSTEANPEYTYKKAGAYKVCLTISDGATGCQSVMCKNILYTPVNEAFIQADFSFFHDPTGLSVIFRDLSSSNVTSWYWTMGDGKVVKTQNVVYTYEKPGIYKVCLTAFDKNDSIANSICKEIRVGEIPCIITSDYSYFIDPLALKVGFTAKTKGIVTDYFWTFGDGNSSTLENPVHQYQEAGYYLIKLSVRNSISKCMDEYSQFIQVGSTNCRADFLYHVDPDNNSVKFFDASKGQIAYYYWDFGDGSFSVEQNPQHQYKNPGLYFVRQTVIDEVNGCIDISIEKVQAGEINCAADFVSYIDSESNTAYFKNRVLGNSTAMLWSFGDGSFSTEQNPSHKFSDPGIYSTGLNTYDFSSGCMDYFQEMLLIGDIGIDCEADFVHISAAGNTEVSFSSKSVGDIVEYLWNFGDGSENSAEKEPVHTYNKGGYYNVCLSVINSSGIKNMECKWVLVKGEADNSCRANFFFSVDSVSRKVTFADRSFGEIDKYTWDFGDSRADSVSFAKSPSHTYDAKGYYLVHLKVENSVSGCESNEYKLLNIGELQVLKASFGYEAKDPEKKVSGYPVDLVSASSGDGATVEWDFGDKQIKKESLSFTVMDSTSGIITHYYEKPGKYRVCVRISDKVSGQTDEYCQYVFTKFAVGINKISGLDISLRVYPNPFIDNTTISYSLSENQFIEIAVYDQLGRRLETLVKTRKDAGDYEISWESRNLTAGIYHLKLITENGVITRQLVLSK